MKKTILWLLTLCLVLAAASALAAPKLPVTAPAPIARPADVDWSYTVEGDLVTIQINDSRPLRFVNFFWGDDVDPEPSSVDLTPDAQGKLTYTLQPGQGIDPACGYVDIYFDNENSDNVTYDLNGTVIGYWAWTQEGNSESSYYWNSDGTQGGVYLYIMDENGNMADFNFDPATNDLNEFFVYTPSSYGHYDEKGNLLDAHAYINDKDYSYSDGQWFDENGEPCAAPMSLTYFDDILEELLAMYGSKRVDEVKWYPENSVCAAGLSVRDDLKISDLWYNVVPIDLTQEGTQELYLIAGNRHHIGKAYVTVMDGQATVTYRLRGGHGYIKSECVKWFTSLDQITEEFLKNPASDLSFGQAVNIEEELGGADVGILFIRNTATYRQPYTNGGYELSRYWRNRDRWIEWRDGLNALLEK